MCVCHGCSVLLARRANIFGIVVCGIGAVLKYHAEAANVESNAGNEKDYHPRDGLLLALLIRDTKAEGGRVTEADWARIDELLKESWRSLAKAVKAYAVSGVRWQA